MTTDIHLQQYREYNQCIENAITKYGILEAFRIANDVLLYYYLLRRFDYTQEFMDQALDTRTNKE